MRSVYNGGAQSLDDKTQQATSLCVVRGQFRPRVLLRRFFRGKTQQATDRSRKGPLYRQCGLKLEQVGGSGSPTDQGHRHRDTALGL